MVTMVKIHNGHFHLGILRAEQTSTTSSKTSQPPLQPAVSNQSQTECVQYHEQGNNVVHYIVSLNLKQSVVQ